MKCCLVFVYLVNMVWGSSASSFLQILTKPRIDGVHTEVLMPGLGGQLAFTGHHQQLLVAPNSVIKLVRLRENECHD